MPDPLSTVALADPLAPFGEAPATATPSKPAAASPERDPSRHPTTVDVVPVGGVDRVALDPLDAEDAFRAGKVEFHRLDAAGNPATQHVRRADGTIDSVPVTELGAALDAGAHLASAADARAYALERDHGGTWGTIEAALLGAGDVASFGLLGGVGTPDEREETAFIRGRHPLAHGLGEVGGLVATAAIPGLGIGGAAEEMGTSLAARAGIGTETLAGRVLTKGIAQAARAGVESAQLAHVDMLTEDGINGGNHPLTAEQYFATLGEAALYGAAFGGAGAAATELGKAGLGAAKAGIGGLFTRGSTASDVERVAESTYGFVPKGLGDAYVRVASVASGGGKEAEEILRAGGIQNQSAAARAVRAAVSNIDEERDAAARAVREHIDTMMADSRALEHEASGAMKRSHIDAAVEKGNPIRVADHSADTIASLRGEISSMIADEETFGQTGLLTSMEKEIGRYERQIQVAGIAENNAEQFALLDDAKRAIGREARLVKSVMGRQINTVALRQARATFDKLDSLYEGLRGNLENESVWGKAAADQRAINAAYTRQIAASRQFRSALARVVGEERFGGKIFGADPAKVERYVRGLVNPSNDLVHAQVREYASATRDLTKAIGDAYELTPQQAERVQRVAQAAKALDETTASMSEKLAKANQLKALLEKEAHGNPVLRLVLGHTVGGAIGGAIGASTGDAKEGVEIGIAGLLLGGAAGVLARPGGAIMRLAAVERMSAKMEGRMGAALRSILRTGEEGEAKAAAKTTEATARKTPPVLRQFGEAQRTGYERRAKELEAETAERTIARVAAHAGPLQQHAPKVAAAFAAVSAAAAAFLAAKLPPKPPDDPLTGQKGQPSQSAIARFIRYAEAVENPTGVLQRVADRRATYEEVEALRTVYPQMYAQARAQVAELLTEQRAEGRPPVDYQTRVQLGLLFDLPVASPESTAHAQATLTAPPAKESTGAPSGGKVGSLSKDLRTRTEQIEGAAD